MIFMGFTWSEMSIGTKKYNVFLYTVFKELKLQSQTKIPSWEVSFHVYCRKRKTLCE